MAVAGNWRWNAKDSHYIYGMDLASPWREIMSCEYKLDVTKSGNNRYDIKVGRVDVDSDTKWWPRYGCV